MVQNLHFKGKTSRGVLLLSPLGTPGKCQSVGIIVKDMKNKNKYAANAAFVIGRERGWSLQGAALEILILIETSHDCSWVQPISTSSATNFKSNLISLILSVLTYKTRLY